MVSKTKIMGTIRQLLSSILLSKLCGKLVFQPSQTSTRSTTFYVIYFLLEGYSVVKTLLKSMGVGMQTYWNEVTHYNDVIMASMASQITSLTIVYSAVIRAQIKENIKAPHHWPLCGEFTGDRWAGNSPGTGEFPAQKASNAENVSIWWRHNVCYWTYCVAIHLLHSAPVPHPIMHHFVI